MRRESDYPLKAKGVTTFVTPFAYFTVLRTPRKGEVFWYPLARLHLSDKLIDGFGEMLRVFPSDEISEVYYAGGVDAWDTVFC